jgi:multiple sugar transport system ATP-binding protein
MASKIVVMKDGKVQQIGAPLYLYNYPINKFVASFIGSPSMNFLVVKVLEEGSDIVLEEGSFRIRPDASHAEHLKNYVGREVFFGIRPEDLDYNIEGKERNSFSVKITVVEPLGADIHLWLTTNTQQLVARTGPYYDFKVGETAHFSPLMEKARYFDKETELAIIPGPPVSIDNA